MTEHVLDDLELYALGALPDDDAARVTLHLEACLPCRTEAARLAVIVDTLSTTLPMREPSAALRERIIASARAERVVPVAPARARWAWPRVPSWAPIGALVIAGAVLLVADVQAASQLNALREERDQYQAIAVSLSQAGRSWYMGGADQWAGSGGTLFVMRDTGGAFVLFHDLKRLPEGRVYSLWLVTGEGKWVRGPSFSPDGRKLQKLDLDLGITGYERCVVTMENPSSGSSTPRTIVMQSRIAPAP